MNQLSPFAAAALVTPIDPYELQLHLEVCRMQAELEVARVASPTSRRARPTRRPPAR